MKNNAQRFTINPTIKVNTDSNEKYAENVYEICKRLRLFPFHIVQIGAANSGEFEFMDFIKMGSKAILFEPHPTFYKELIDKWGKIDNITIYDIGIYNQVGKFKFYEKWASSCLEECSKIPLILHYDQKFDENNIFFANCALFSGFDEGNIDLLLIDSNGAEWYCLEKLISRPTIICIETHYIYRNYVNPYIQKIDAWMVLNDYIIYAKNESDTVFLRTK